MVTKRTDILEQPLSKFNLKELNICNEGIPFCKSRTAKESWYQCYDPAWLIWVATNVGVQYELLLIVKVCCVRISRMIDYVGTKELNLVKLFTDDLIDFDEYKQLQDKVYNTYIKSRKNHKLQAKFLFILYCCLHISENYVTGNDKSVKKREAYYSYSCVNKIQKYYKQNESEESLIEFNKQAVDIIKDNLTEQVFENFKRQNYGR